MGLFIAVSIIAIVVGVSIGLAIEERNDVQKRQAKLEKEVAELKEEIKQAYKFLDVEV